MSKLKSTFFLWFFIPLFICFLTPLFFGVVQPIPAVSQQPFRATEEYVNNLTNPLWFPELHIDSEFSTKEASLIAGPFLFLYPIVKPDRYDLSNRYIECLRKYHEFPWYRMSHDEKMKVLSRDVKGELISGNIIQKLQKASQMQVDGRRRRLYIDADTTPADKETGLITMASTQEGVWDKNQDIHIKVNKTWLKNIDGQDISKNTMLLGGALFHELIHTIGYTHPRKILPDFSNVQGNIVYESGWCVNRYYVDKPPGSPNLTDNSDLFVD